MPTAGSRSNDAYCMGPATIPFVLGGHVLLCQTLSVGEHLTGPARRYAITQEITAFLTEPATQAPRQNKRGRPQQSPHLSGYLDRPSWLSLYPHDPREAP